MSILPKPARVSAMARFVPPCKIPSGRQFFSERIKNPSTTPSPTAVTVIPIFPIRLCFIAWLITSTGVSKFSKLKSITVYQKYA
jgi:hypothetical protein